MLQCIHTSTGREFSPSVRSISLKFRNPGWAEQRKVLYWVQFLYANRCTYYTVSDHLSAEAIWEFRNLQLSVTVTQLQLPVPQFLNQWCCSLLVRVLFCMCVNRIKNTADCCPWQVCYSFVISNGHTFSLKEDTYISDGLLKTTLAFFLSLSVIIQEQKEWLCMLIVTKFSRTSKIIRNKQKTST